MAARAPLPDAYLDWVHKQGVPIIEDFGIDIRTVPVAPWARYGMNGAFCHLKGRDDYISIFAFELPPGAKSAQLKHICEEVIYVISGHGSTSVTLEDGRKHFFEWGPKSLSPFRSMPRISILTDLAVNRRALLPSTIWFSP